MLGDITHSLKSWLVLGILVVTILLSGVFIIELVNRGGNLYLFGLYLEMNLPAMTYKKKLKTSKLKKSQLYC